MRLDAQALGLVVSVCAWLCVGCGSDDAPKRVLVGTPYAGDAGEEMTADAGSAANLGCVDVMVDGKSVVEHLDKFTARFEAGTAYDRTLMLFGGMPVEKPDAVRRAYLFGLDKVDAQRMAMKYPDFYLCTSPGGEEASMYIRAYSIVPATCAIHQQIVAALRVYNANARRGGDRTSLELKGAPLTLKSATADATGQDVSDQVSGEFHLITSVKQLTGESVVKFGTTD